MAKLNADKIANIHNINMKWFPTENEKIIFKDFVYRGQGSPKFKINFVRNGKVYKAKLKLGEEVHTDKAVSKLGELVGLNQDQMLHRKHVKLF